MELFLCSDFCISLRIVLTAVFSLSRAVLMVSCTWMTATPSDTVTQRPSVCAGSTCCLAVCSAGESHSHLLKRTPVLDHVWENTRGRLPPKFSQNWIMCLHLTRMWWFYNCCWHCFSQCCQRGRNVWPWDGRTVGYRPGGEERAVHCDCACVRWGAQAMLFSQDYFSLVSPISTSLTWSRFWP